MKKNADFKIFCEYTSYMEYDKYEALEYGTCCEDLYEEDADEESDTHEDGDLYEGIIYNF
jgi:hypothetical protein